MKKEILFLMLILMMFVSFGQDYQITFAGSGESTQVETVKVENLTQSKSLVLIGSEVLHLKASTTGTIPVSETEYKLHFYPNPTNGNSTIDFVTTTYGIVKFELFDITGKSIGRTYNLLPIGNHSYSVSNLYRGIYNIKISSQSNTYFGKLVSVGTTNSETKINYIASDIIPPSSKKLKSSSSETIMQYNTGDRLKITGTTGNYTTVVTLVPTQSETVTFPFFDCTDSDGNNYPIVQIGSQIWMDQNLKTTKYRNGDTISYVNDNTAWSNLTGEAYCWYNNELTNKDNYGALYNWYAVNDDRDIAPIGWHVASDAEWTTLTNYMGGVDVAGGKLKETGTTHWEYPNQDATDETGFLALPGGYRENNGFYNFEGISAYWWSSTINNIGNGGWYFALTWNNGKIYRMANINRVGYSVRCIKD